MASPPRKNILLMVADDLGRDLMGCYGSKTGATSNLDRLAASGAKFDNAFTSTASCSGSRTVIYTGLHTHQTGSYGLTHDTHGFQTFANVETAPMLFNEIGYKTGIIGKVHVSPRSQYPWRVNQESDTRNVAHIADQADEFFKQSNAEEKPFFLTVGFVDPHREIGKRGGFGNQEDNYDPKLKDRIFTSEEVDVPPFLSDIPLVRQEIAEYFRAINRMDQGVGLILDALERAGLTDSTMVLFISDNGPPFINSKTTLFDAGVRLPFLLRAPGLTPPGLTNNNMISWVDILPTFLDWAGHGDIRRLIDTKDAPRRQGRSILPVIAAEAMQPGWDRVFGSHTFHEVTNYWPTRYMRDSQYKYHRNVCWKLDFPFAMDLYASLSFEGMRNSGSEGHPPMVGQRRLRDYIRRPAEELYDLAQDPAEVENLALKPEHAGRVREMREALEQWQKDTADLWLWRDGVSVTNYLSSDYAREGLCIPDQFDMNADKPETTAAPPVKLL